MSNEAVLPQGSNFIFSLQNKNIILLHKSKSKIVLGEYFTKPSKTMYIIIYTVLFNKIHINKYYTALILQSNFRFPNSSANQIVLFVPGGCSLSALARVELHITDLRSLGCILIVFCLCTQTVLPCCFFHVFYEMRILMHGNFKNASWDHYVDEL